MGEATRVITIESDKAGVITGADVQTDADVEIINKDHVLATLTDSVPFMMEMVVENGRGYVPASEHSSAEHEIGIIPIDAVFSPITRVRYEIEETRVGQKTNYDKLTIEVTTNGSITPEMALVEAAKILRKHLNPFVQYFELKEDLAVEGGGLAPEGDESAKRKELDELLSKSVDILDLSVRSKNCLDSENIQTLRDLVILAEAEVLKFRNFGKTSLKEVKSKLAALGLSLGMVLEEPTA